MKIATRFDGASRRQAGASLALFVLALAGALAGAHPPAAPPRTGGAPPQTDLQLYRRIAAAVQRGEGYYAAAAEAQRQGGYPLRPAFAMRLPTLAVSTAWLGEANTARAMAALSGAVIAAWFVRLRALAGLPAALSFTALLALGAAPMNLTSVSTFHESWAGLLVALSLALWRPGRAGWGSAAIALSAALIRETAMPFLPMMGLAAIASGRRRAATLWFAALGLWLGLFLLHARAVAGVALPGDLASPGWFGLGGWAMFVGGLNTSSLLAAVSHRLTSVTALLGICGWICWRDPLGMRAAGWLLGMAALLMIFARPDNFYWALMPAVLLTSGLVFVPAAARSLFAALRGGGQTRE